MDRKTLELLEFPKMIELACGLAETEKGRDAVLVLQPHTDREAVEELLDETSEGREFLENTASPLAGPNR